MGSDPKMLTVLSVTTGKLFFKRLPSLKLLAAFSTLIPKEKVSTMSWDDQIFAEEGRDLVFRLETAPQATQRPQAPILGPLNMIYRSAESAFQLGRVYNMTSLHDCDILSHMILTCGTVTTM